MEEKKEQLEDLVDPLDEGLFFREGPSLTELGDLPEIPCREMLKPVPLSGMQLFTMGPVYAQSGVDTDIAASFLYQGGVNPVEGLVNIAYQTPIMLGVEGWENILQAMPYEFFDDFCRYAHSMVFIRKTDKEYINVEAHEVVLSGLLQSRPVAPIYVFCGTSDKARCVPQVLYQGQPMIVLVDHPPDPFIVRQAKAYAESR